VWLLFPEALLRNTNGKIERLALWFCLQLELNPCVLFCILIIQTVPLLA
jgi:hypothetical protein